MDNQHTRIKGYRDLSQDEIALMNEIKAMGEQVGALVGKLSILAQREWERKDKDAGLPVLDGRWVSIGKTHLQQGFMCLVRAVAKSTTF